MKTPDLAKQIQNAIDLMIRELQGMGLAPTFIELKNARAAGCRLCGIEEGEFDIQITYVVPENTKLGLVEWGRVW